MADLITNLSLVKNGQQTTWNAPEGKKVKSARIRWRARPSEFRDVEAKATGTTSAKFPNLPAPATIFMEHLASISYVTDHEPYNDWLRLDVNGKEIMWQPTTWYQENGKVYCSAYIDGWQFGEDPLYGQTLRIIGYYNGSSWTTISSPSIELTTVGRYRYYYPAVTNIRVTYNGQQITGPASLQDGAYSGWYDIPVLTGATSITLNHAMGGLGEVYYQLEITYLTIKPAWVMVDGVLREVVSIHAMVEGVLRQIDDTQIMIDNSPR